MKDYTSVLNDVVKRIVVGYDPDKILLFGSFSSNTANEDSDLDLLLIKSTDEHPMSRGKSVYGLLKGVPIPVDIKIYTPRELEEYDKSKWSFYAQIKSELKLLYEKK